METTPEDDAILYSIAQVVHGERSRRLTSVVGMMTKIRPLMMCDKTGRRRGIILTRRSWVSLADEPTFAFTDPSFSRMKDSGVDWLTRESRVVIGRAPARSKNPTWRRFPAALPSSLGCGAHGCDDICFDTSPAGVGSRARRTAHGAASGGDPGRGIVGSNRRGVDARVRRRGLRSEARAGSRARGT